MKTRPLYIFLLSLLAQNAWAEHRLFPTDILEKGEADLAFSINQAHSTNSTLYAGTWSGRQILDQTGEQISFRYGLGNDWHVGASGSYNSEYRSRTNYDNGPSYLSTKYKGQRNPSIWVKYGFISDKASPFTLSGELKVSPDTTGNGTEWKMAKLFGGWDFGNELKAFATYGGNFPDGHGYSTTHTVSAGAFKSLTNTLTLIPSITYTKVEANAFAKGSDQHAASLGALVEIGHDTYLRASAELAKIAHQDSKDGLYRWGEVTGKSWSAEFYRLF